jgi:ABC-type branched-subunit amino acid transport system ATPase component
MGNLILNSLEIRNFRAFRNFKIDHLGRVNLLVGKNNVGKTSLLEAIWLQANTASTPCILIPSQGLSGQRLIELWDGIALTNLKEEVLSALRLIVPGLVDLDFVSATLSNNERMPVVKIAGNEESLPLDSLGEGMLRALGISLALVNAKDGLLLIDEFENGLYYTVQPEIWQFIFRVARNLNVQVFATTHSWDCIQAFQKASSSGYQADGLLIRLESLHDDIVATLFDEGTLGIATREHIEVR